MEFGRVIQVKVTDTNIFLNFRHSELSLSLLQTDVCWGFIAHLFSHI